MALVLLISLVVIAFSTMVLKVLDFVSKKTVSFKDKIDVMILSIYGFVMKVSMFTFAFLAIVYFEYAIFA